VTAKAAPNTPRQTQANMVPKANRELVLRRLPIMPFDRRPRNPIIYIGCGSPTGQSSTLRRCGHARRW
jgi:hypothetical protein